MFAIIKTGGKQYIVSPGSKIKVEKLETPENSGVVFDNVLLVSGGAGTETIVGTPYVKNYVVKGKIIAQGKGEKIIVYKYKPKKRYHKKQGHRQLYTEVEILEITSGDANKSAEATPKATRTAKTKISPAS